MIAQRPVARCKHRTLCHARGAWQSERKDRYFLIFMAGLSRQEIIH